MTPPTTELDALLSLLSPDRHSDPDLERELLRAWNQARAEWLAVVLDFDALAPILAREIERAPGLAPSQTLASLHVADLYLACACARGDPAAARAMDARCRPAILEVARRVCRSRELCDDVAQKTCDLLFVRRGDAPPKISGYSGRGDLRSWVLVVAAREAVRLSKASHREEPTEPSRLVALLPGSDDLELESLRRVYRPEFERALRDALAELEPRDRTVLKYHYVDGLNGRRVAALYKVHPATVTRWLESAREAVGSRTRAILQERLGLGRPELESLERLVRSQLALSLSRHLADAANG